MVECATVDATRPTLSSPDPAAVEAPPERRRGCCSCGCLIWLALLALGLLLAAALFLPGQSRVLLLGIDRPPQGTAVARTDSMVLLVADPSRPYVRLLSIPRDLWVTLPDGSQNRINTAHFFAEAAQAGSGPGAAKATVENNFGVRIHGTLRLDFEALRALVDALGGITVKLEAPSLGLPPGEHPVDGTMALALARDRYGSDDFARMARGQWIGRAILRRMLEPEAWPRLPGALLALRGHVALDIPPLHLLRVAFAILRSGPGGMESFVLDREMAQGVVTEAGAQVLLPRWERIGQLVNQVLAR